MPATDMQEQIDRVAACGPIRAWSVIVTVLGDLCRTREDWIGAPVLNALIGRLGISAQAGRVAIHRLRRDGWVETERRGRASLYRLSASGWETTEAVRPRVYARVPPPADAVLVVGPPDQPQADFAATLGEGAVVMAPRTALVTAGTRLDVAHLAAPLAPGAVPDWVEPLLAGFALCADYSALADAASAAALPADAGDPLDATALRLAILHHWRRLCLRHSPLADTLMPGGWPGQRARAAVLDALDRLPRPDPETLSRAARPAAELSD